MSNRGSANVTAVTFDVVEASVKRLMPVGYGPRPLRAKPSSLVGSAVFGYAILRHQQQIFLLSLVKVISYFAKWHFRELFMPDGEEVRHLYFNRWVSPSSP